MSTEEKTEVNTDNPNSGQKPADEMGVRETFAYIRTTFREHFLSGERLIAAAFTAFVLAYISQIISNPSFFELESYFNSINFAGFFIVAVIAFAALAGVTWGTKIANIIPRVTVILTVVLSVMFGVASDDKSLWFILGVGVVDFIVILWAVKDDKLEISDIKVSYTVCLGTAIGLFLFTAVFFGYVTSIRYLSFNNSTFDFGIFAQMFERMANTCLPDTTVEREGLTSHFGVHFSPFFYLLLPGYYIFRTPLYLIYSQSAAVAAGVFAVYLISRRLGFSGRVTLALELMYIVYPSLFNGCFYDYHENKFLTVIILFLFYFIIADKTLWTYVFAVLLLSVKEDAAIYLAAIALFVLFYLKKRLKGGIMLAMSVVYFLIAQRVVEALGTDGVMMWRLSDYFINGEEGFGSVIKSIIFDFGFLVKQMFTADKVPFLIWMLAPVMFTPFMHRRASAFLLLLPIIPINLMQAWIYQYNIDFQYTYGVAALIIMSAVYALQKLSGERKRVIILMSMCFGAIMTCTLTGAKIGSAAAYKGSVESQLDGCNEAISKIPADSSVTVYHKLMPHCYFADEIISADGKSESLKQTDYFVLDMRDPDQLAPMYTAMGDDYKLFSEGGFVQVYSKVSG